MLKYKKNKHYHENKNLTKNETTEEEKNKESANKEEFQLICYINRVMNFGI